MDEPTIPQHAAFEIQLPSFEGPLDLLLHLIKRHELDVLDLPIAFVTARYLDYLRMMQELDLDVASEYLLMAATLAHIKSKMLLPAAPSDGIEEQEQAFQEDPRAELIRRLLEYQKYKLAASQLGERPLSGRDVFRRGVPAPEAQGPAPLAPIDLYKLLDAFQAILKRVQGRVALEVSAETITIQERISQLTDVLREKRSCVFDELFTGARTRYEVIVTFLALLEMTKLRITRIYQADPTAALHVQYALLDAEVPTVPPDAVTADSRSQNEFDASEPDLSESIDVAQGIEVAEGFDLTEGIDLVEGIDVAAGIDVSASLEFAEESDTRESADEMASLSGAGADVDGAGDLDRARNVEGVADGESTADVTRDVEVADAVDVSAPAEPGERDGGEEGVHVLEVEHVHGTEGAMLGEAERDASSSFAAAFNFDGELNGAPAHPDAPHGHASEALEDVSGDEALDDVSGGEALDDVSACAAQAVSQSFVVDEEGAGACSESSDVDACDEAVSVAPGSNDSPVTTRDDGDAMERAGEPVENPDHESHPTDGTRVDATNEFEENEESKA